MDEYISREEAIEAIRYRVCQGQGNKEHICKRGSCAYCGIMEIMNDISSIEAADVQPVKHGRWIENSDPGQNINEHYMCSECGCTFHNWANDNYCPNCGSKQDL